VYIPSAYIEAFVDYLDMNSLIAVKAAEDGAYIENGTCYVASAETYMTITEGRDGLKLHINPAPFGAEEQSSINMLFYSVADLLTETAVGIILGGSGKDGIEGIKEMLRVGARVIVQSPATCMEPQMPGSVIEKTQAQEILPDVLIADTVNKFIGEVRG
jgi:two-component system chemotaxis response regulator CheB